MVVFREIVNAGMTVSTYRNHLLGLELRVVKDSALSLHGPVSQFDCGSSSRASGAGLGAVGEGEAGLSDLEAEPDLPYQIVFIAVEDELLFGHSDMGSVLGLGIIFGWQLLQVQFLVEIDSILEVSQLKRSISLLNSPREVSWP